MSQEYTKERIYTEDELQYLREYYTRLPGVFFSFNLTLYNVTKRNILPNDVVEAKFMDLVDRAMKHAGATKKIQHHYLHYGVDSFCTMHVDDPSYITRTSVTLLDKSEDLDGGDTLLYTRLQKDMIRPGQIRVPDRMKNAENALMVGKQLVPEMIKQDVGETLFYDTNTVHGVTRVNKGHRLVLISWFGKQ